MQTKYTRKYLLSTPQGKRLVRRRINVKKDRSGNLVAIGILLGMASGCLYLDKLGEVTTEFVARAIEPTPIISTQAPSNAPALTSDEGEVEALIQMDDAGQQPPASSKQEIIEYIVEVFGEDAPEAFNVLYCENRTLNPSAVNVNRNGTRDLGVFQLNDGYHGGEENFDYKTNIDKAYKIFEAHGKKWTAWTCSHRVDQKNYLGQ